MAVKATDWGLLFCRLALGIVFTAHGYEKLFVLGISWVQGFLASLHVPAPNIFAYVLTYTEFAGGILMLLGLLTRLVAMAQAIAMLVAILTVHISNGFFAPAGVEFPLTLLLITLAVLFGGSGKFSVDALIFGRERDKVVIDS